jgi:hypothetical protein
MPRREAHLLRRAGTPPAPRLLRVQSCWPRALAERCATWCRISQLAATVVIGVTERTLANRSRMDGLAV